MQKIPFIIVILFLLSTILSAQDSLQWTDSFPAAMEKAKNENKVIMIDFSGNWCGWCKRLHETTFQDSNVIELLNDNFVPIEINTSLKENRDLANNYNITGLPQTIIFANPNSNEIDRIVGYLPADEFIKKANFVLNNKNYFQNLTEQAEANPDSIEIQTRLAEVYEKRGSYNNAEKIYTNILKNLEKTDVKDSLQIKIPEIKGKIAMLYFSQRQYSEALEKLKLLSNKYPEYPKMDEILFNQALCFYRLKEYQETEGNLEKIIETFPQSSLKEDAEKFLEYLSSHNKKEKSSEE